VKIYTKKELIQRLKSIAEQGWIPNARHGNQGSVGNTLEDLLEIPENNLPIPNAAEWELKTQRMHTTSLTTLFHSEPSPRAIRFVPQVLLPKYGWASQEVGKKYAATEMSFRQTIHGAVPSDRGFMVKIDRAERKILISFDAAKVAPKHAVWLQDVERRVGLEELNPQPYWGFDDLEHIAGTKLLNCFYIQADVKKEGGREHYWYRKALMLQKFSFEGFLQALEQASLLVDFDARTGHNHGTKFRLRQNHLPTLYQHITTIVNIGGQPEQERLIA
jgi:hypothetical protein